MLASVLHVPHLLTPQTETTTHYFWAVLRNFRLQEEALTESIRAATGATFSEDKAVLEQQQRQLDALGSKMPRVAIRLDAAPMQARRLLED